MPASIPSPEAGRQLKAARIRVQLSIREVERLSRQLAEEKKSRDYYISHAWLTEVESGIFTPSIYKLYSLSVIYKYNYDEILAWFGVRIADIGREQMRVPLRHTYAFDMNSAKPLAIPPELKDKAQLEKTNLVSRMFREWGGLPVTLLPRKNSPNSIYGYVGTEDFALYPLIRPGSFVEIDANQRKINHTNWSTVFDRPIYFVELRDSYACSWCELKEGSLLLVPFPRPRSKVREVRFPGEAGIIGRVTAVSMRIADTK